MSNFQKQLIIAFAALAFFAAIQGVLGLWAVSTAVHNVQRGRVASDLLTSYLKLSANKQRLKFWLAQTLLNAQPEPRAQDKLLQLMRDDLAELNRLAASAVRLDGSNNSSKIELKTEHSERQNSLDILKRSINSLQYSFDHLEPSVKNTDTQLVWQTIREKFDVAEGRDLRTLLAESIAREQAALLRDRALANASLNLLKSIAIIAMLTLALAAILLAIYFVRTLRKPLEELNAGALALQSGDLLHRIPSSKYDEFSRLAHSVNQMAAELYLHRENEVKARQKLEFLVLERTSELELAVDKLEKLDLRRRQLFADISHELRTPTTAIRGEAEITLRGRDKPLDEYKTALVRIVNSAQQLGLVIDDLLTMARTDIDMLALERAKLAVNLPLNEALDYSQALCNRRSIQLEMTNHTQAIVLGDVHRLRQLFILLLDNAISYSYENAKVSVTSEIVQDSLHIKQAAQWQLTIVDEGIGIAAEEMPHIFERNYRSAKAKKLRPDGSGLGLGIAAALTRAHGGQLNINSKPGVGTTVQVWLPLISQQDSL